MYIGSCWVLHVIITQTAVYSAPQCGNTVQQTVWLVHVSPAATPKGPPMAPPAAAPATEAATAAPLLLAKCSTRLGICKLVWDQDLEVSCGKGTQLRDTSLTEHSYVVDTVVT